MTDNHREPLIPRQGEPAGKRTEHKLTYRNPETGEAYERLATAWMQERNQLRRMGYEVVVQRREISQTAWETIGDGA
ncbi:hypothetical protein [Nocardia brasiliensis]|uniref:hypothetical protein n=1 Tax=Nocardia brasiliensis TaxID=37326 RepID=UPI00245726E1|nr:hypothetical protein [Nocardia brasiliensis]